MQISVNSNVLVVGVLFCIGYFIIIISVINDKKPDYNKVLLQYQSSEQENSALKLLLSQKEQLLDQVYTPAQPTTDAEKSQQGEVVEVAKDAASSAEQRFQGTAVRPGVIILGMHRSGTSVIGGLANKMGLNTGGPLIAPAEDNKKGFFERIDVVLQNDELMKQQNVHYAWHTAKYDALKGLQDVLLHRSEIFREGERGLNFLNNAANYPWMLKDPRLCITLRTWLPLLNFIPAVLFTYRHPFDVALSMHKRTTENFKISKVLKMWYVYNKRGIEQSNDLCRVVSTHRLMMTQPNVELKRIYDELHECGVDVPHEVAEEDVLSFIDIKLQHGKTTLVDTSCGGDLSSLTPPVESWPTEDAQHLALYRECMRAYCAMEDGTAFTAHFQWDQSIIDDQ